MRCRSRPTATPRWSSPRGAPARCDSLHRSSRSVNYRHMTKPATLGELQQTEWASPARINRTVKDELRQLVTLLDEEIPILAGSEVNDSPFAPISKFGRELVAEHGDRTPITWLPREMRYVEKLATPDVTIADIIGDVDPIKAARGGHL